MPDNPRTLTQLQSLFQDNGTGQISAQDLRDFLVSAYQPQFPVAGGRLTTESGVPVSTSDRLAQSTIYYTPFLSDRLGLYDGSGWWLLPYAEFGLALSGLSIGGIYDVFAFATAAVPSSTDTGTDTLTFGSAQGWATGSVVTCDATGGGLTAGTYYFYRAATATTGTLHATLADAFANTSKVNLTASITATLTGVSLELSAAWASSSSRTDAITTLNGALVKSANTTRRLLGTVRSLTATTTEDSRGGTTSQTGGRRFVWNLYNQVHRPLAVIDTTNSWSYTSATVRQANAAGGNMVEFVCGQPTAAGATLAVGVAVSSNSLRAAHVGVGVDSTTAFSGLRAPALNASASNNFYPAVGQWSGTVAAGYHFLAWLESGSDGNCDFLGDNNVTTTQGGLTAFVWG